MVTSDPADIRHTFVTKTNMEMTVESWIGALLMKNTGVCFMQHIVASLQNSIKSVWTNTLR